MTTDSRADERKAAEQEYTVSAFDYPSNPVGSRDWTLFWQGWQARARAIPAVPAPSDAMVKWREEAGQLVWKAMRAARFIGQGAGYNKDADIALAALVNHLSAVPVLPTSDGVSPSDGQGISPTDAAGKPQAPCSDEHRFEHTYCSQCGGAFGPGNEGFSHCIDHGGKPMNCEHKLTPDPRSGIRFCSKCGIDERKVKQEQQPSMDDAIADAMIDANLSPKFCLEYATTLQAFGRAVWTRAALPSTPPADALALLREAREALQLMCRSRGSTEPIPAERHYDTAYKALAKINAHLAAQGEKG